MARTKISEYSETAADNTDINSINIAEGCAPSGINNAIREMMKQLKDFQSGTSGDPLVSTSTVTATKLVPTGNVTAGNGMYLPAANVVAFSTNGSERVRVDSNGNVGIGVTPSANLDVFKGATGLIARFEGADLDSFNVKSENDLIALDTRNTTNGLTFQMQGTERMRITTAGNVGIGDTVPEGRLNVVQGSAISSGETSDKGTLYLKNSGSITQAVGSLASGIGFTGTGSGGRRRALIAAYQATSSANQTGLKFFTYGATATAFDTVAERMVIDHAGNVGIGTSSPEVKLEVDGEVRANSRLSSKAMTPGVDIWETNGNSAFNRTFIVQNSNALSFQTRNSSFAFVSSDYISDKGSSGATNHRFLINGSERMRIDSSGNVLVAQTTTVSPGNGNTIVGSGIGANGRFWSSATAANHGFNRNGAGILISCHESGNTVGSISVTTTATAYNTSSDYRLKENLAPIEDALTRVAAIPVYRFNFKADPDKTVDGFVAHELAPYVPEAVTGEKDEMQTEEYQVEAAKGEIFIPAVEEVLDDEGEVVTEAQDEQIIASDVTQPEELPEGQQWRETTPAVMGEREVPAYQGVDQSKLTPLLTAAIQQLLNKVEALEAEVAALKGQA